MNGFEFLSIVRRQFPQLPVIAVSGEFSDFEVPQSVLADAFFEKSEYSPDQLIVCIADLLRKAPLRSPVKKSNMRARTAHGGSVVVA